MKYSYNHSIDSHPFSDYSYSTGKTIAFAFLKEIYCINTLDLFKLKASRILLIEVIDKLNFCKLFNFDDDFKIIFI